MVGWCSQVVTGGDSGGRSRIVSWARNLLTYYDMFFFVVIFPSKKKKKTFLLPFSIQNRKAFSKLQMDLANDNEVEEIPGAEAFFIDELDDSATEAPSEDIEEDADRLDDSEDTVAASHDADIVDADQ